MKPTSLAHPTCIALILAIVLPLQPLTSAPVNESFAYPVKPFAIPEAHELSNRIFQTFLSGGSGWSSSVGDIGWILNITTPPNQPEYFFQGMRVYEFTPMVEGSLTYQDSGAKALAVEGNHLRNSTEVPQRWDRDLPLRDGPFQDMFLEGISVPETNRERSTDGIGGPGVIWFGALLEMQNKENGIGVFLSNPAYSVHPMLRGLTMRFHPDRKVFWAGQEWPGAHSFGAAVSVAYPKSLDPTKPFWLVAKITFGEEWGTSEAFAEVDGTKLADAKVKATGNLTIWINPDLSMEPSPATALVNIPLLEFRFSKLLVDLPTGNAIDEIRMGKSFEEILTP